MQMKQWGSGSAVGGLVAELRVEALLLAAGMWAGGSPQVAWSSGPGESGRVQRLTGGTHKPGEARTKAAIFIEIVTHKNVR